MRVARAFAPSPPTHSRATRIAPPAPSPSPGAAAPPFSSRDAADAPRAAQPSPSAFAALVRAPARARAPSRRRRAPPRSSSSSSARRMARAAAAAAAAAAASAVRDAGAPGARAHGSRTVYAYVLILTVYAYDKLNLRLSTGRRRTDRKDRKSGEKAHERLSPPRAAKTPYKRESKGYRRCDERAE